MGNVTIKQGGATTITLARNTVAAIQAMPREVAVASPRGAEVVARNAQTTPVARPNNVEVGKMGLQGPKGDPGTNGAGQVAPIAFAFGDATPKVVYTMPIAGTLAECAVVIDTLFNGVSPSLQLGTAGSPGAFIDTFEVAPTIAAEFATSPTVALAAGEEILLTIVPGVGCTQGAGRVFLTILES